MTSLTTKLIKGWILINKKIAIVTDSTDIYSQTFIRRHINKLNGGNTAVILTKKKASLIEKPTFVYQPNNKIKTLLLRIKRLDFSSENELLNEDLIKFIKTNNIGYALGEFGYIGIKIYKPLTKLNIPFYCYFRGADASLRLNNNQYVINLKKMMSEIQGIISVSQSLIDNLKKYGIEHPNTHVIPSGVDTNAFKPSVKDKNLFLAVGRFIAKKAPDITISSFARVLKKFPYARLEMIGDGELLADCMQLSKDLGISENIIFHGNKNHDFVKSRLEKASIFLQHSIKATSGDQEGMPTAIQEAMSSGCVVISTNHAGIPEHIENNINGLIVDERDLNAYTEAIISVLENDTLRKKMASKAIQYANKHFNYKTNYLQLEKIILE